MPTYTRQPNTFIDPAGHVPTYQWTINHTEEEPVQNGRQMSDGAPTSDIGLLPQQGVPTPLVFHWKGTIFTQQDKDTMDVWFNLCEFQSIFLKDFTGSEYEVLITDFPVQRKGVKWNHRGQVPWLWEYTIIIRVLRVLSGDWSGRPL